MIWRLPKLDGVSFRDATDADSEFMAALEIGECDIQEGRTEPYTPKLLEQIEQDARQSARAGKKPNPDICP